MDVRYSDSTNEDLAGGRLTIDLNALVSNWRFLNSQMNEGECAAVVKANAYGIGIEAAVPPLLQAGCKTFFVALPAEGMRVRAVAPAAKIYVLAGYFPHAFEAYRDFALRPVINDEIECWFDDCPDSPLPFALQIETGMNRLGMASERFTSLCKQGVFNGDRQPSLLMSHLACADTPDHPLNSAQLTAFDGARSLLPDVPTSLANSAGIFLGNDFHFDLARPGIALYGGASTQGHLNDNPMNAVVTVEARILQLKSVPPGQSVGYGASETTKPGSGSTYDKPRTVATVSAGYADGYLRSSGSSDIRKGAMAAWNGHPAPLIGRVSMDLVTVDMSDHPDVDKLLGMTAGELQNQWLELIGTTITLDSVAESAGTIGYELLTGLGARYQRHYIGSSN